VPLEGEPLAGAEVSATFRNLDGDEEREFTKPVQYREIRGVTPHLHSDGALHEHLDVRGVYVVDEAFFDVLGTWRAELNIISEGSGQPTAGDLAFEVKAQSDTPQVGERPPATRNATIEDVGDPSEIDSHVPPYPAMHGMTVEEALGAGKPFMVIWSTPMFCVSQICGPVTDVAIDMHKKYGDRMNFIHIEPWDLQTARTQGRLVPTEQFLEWKLPTEPWVFVVGEDGRITARYEGIPSNEEMEASIMDVLGKVRGRAGL
jgi:hypothetical protein